MAKFYGTIVGNRGDATRLGHTSLQATAQSFSGSIIVNLFEANDEIHVRIGIGVGSTKNVAKNLFEGPIKALFEDASNFAR